MEKTLSVTLMVVFLLLGAVCGVVLAPEKIIKIETIVEKPIETTVEKIVEVDAPNQLDLALAEFLEAVEAEEDESGADVDVLGNYNFDELEVSKVYDYYYVSFEDEVTIVDFEVKLRFKEDDAVAEKENYAVSVRFEEGEDSEVEANLLE